MRHGIMMAVGAFALLIAAPAAAEVVAATPTSFELTQTVTIDKPVPQVWEMLRNPQKWWNKDHSYSGDSANFYLDSQATGCFCEKLPGGGSVEHGRIIFIKSPTTLRLNAPLGPLQGEAVTAILTWTLTAEGENATRIKLTYVVGGHIRGGAEALAPRVDAVLAVQMLGLKSAAEAMSPLAVAPAEQ
jgi:uncharacterized protein YndB with AHSA1/START domain